jgi:2',3'-cyclic-nucleotide 2'-phosphodiesterase (5'-nucleotidase family)
MQRLIILHSNDIHGRIEGLARIATLIDEIRAANPGVPVLYLDGGDSEETARRLSNLTKGVAMHHLLSAAGCAAAAVGNAGLPRYGVEVLEAYAAAAAYPLVLANLRLPDGAPLPGTQPVVMLPVGDLRLGVIGLTADIDTYSQFFGLTALPALPLARELAAALRQDGADAVIVLSHMGLPADRELAAGLQDDVSLILGAHTHDLLPAGEWVGAVLVAQAGEYAAHLGRIDLAWDGEQVHVESVRVLPVPETIVPAARVLGVAAEQEAAAERFLAEIIGELAAPLDYAANRECGVGDFMADVLRERMGADVGLLSVGQAFSGPLPVGPLPRVALWDVCASPANPGVADLTGAQLLALVARGLAPSFVAEQPRPLRGQARGWLHLSGATVRAGRLLVADAPVDPQRIYRVAATDWELEPYGGYHDESWDLHPRYDVPTILREAAEAYLVAHRPLSVAPGRIEGPLAEA